MGPKRRTFRIWREPSSKKYGDGVLVAWARHASLEYSSRIRTRETAGRPGDAVYFGKIKKVFEETGLFEVRKSFR